MEWREGERERPRGGGGRERTTPLSTEDGQPPAGLAVVRDRHVRRAKLVGRQRTVVLERALVDVPDCFTTYQDMVEKGVSVSSEFLNEQAAWKRRKERRGQNLAGGRRSSSSTPSHH